MQPSKVLENGKYINLVLDSSLAIDYYASSCIERHLLITRLKKWRQGCAKPQPEILADPTIFE
jgi:hypothetical protein